MAKESKPSSIIPLPSFDLGHGSAGRFLESCLGTHVPSLLFTGPPGVGKEYTAIDFARKLCCQKSPVCRLGENLCESCAQVSELSHPGIYLMYPTPTAGSREGEEDDLTDINKVLEEKRQDIFTAPRFSKKVSLRIARSRAMIRRAHTKPFGSPYHVFIIVDAHTMREEAQNALLKLVEEPPERCVLIWITPSSDALLYTIRSRCQRVRFSPLKADVVESILVSYYGIEADIAHQAAALAQGSILQAKDLASSYDDRARTVAAELVRNIHREPESKLIGKAMMLSRGANRDDVARFLHELSLVFRDVMTGDESLYFNVDAKQEITALRSVWDARRIPRILDHISRTRDGILRQNMNIEASLAHLFLDIKRSE